VPSAYKQVLETHRRRLIRVAERRGVEKLKPIYNRAQEELVNKLGRLPIGMRSTFTAHAHQVMLAQVRQGQAILAGRLVGEMNDISKEAQGEALHGLVKDLDRLERHYTGSSVVLPIEEAAVFQGIIGDRRRSLMRMNRTSMAGYGGRLVEEMESAMSTSLASGETVIDAIDRIQKVADVEWWQAARIARTETAYAYNSTAADGMKVSAEVIPDLMMRWVEHVSDDGTPLDSRVGVDSIAMHGQVVEPGGVFTMPPATADGEVVPDSLVGKTWENPPNRPNDRSVLSPWRKDWGVPAWIWRDGRRQRV